MVYVSRIFTNGFKQKGHRHLALLLEGACSYGACRRPNWKKSMRMYYVNIIRLYCLPANVTYNGICGIYNKLSQQSIFIGTIWNTVGSHFVICIIYERISWIH